MLDALALLLVVSVAVLAACAFVAVGLSRKAARERDEAERLLAALSDDADEALVLRDLDGRLVRANAAGAAWRGEEDPDADRRVAESGASLAAEEHVDGRAYLVTRAPYRDRRGRVVGVLFRARDVTALRAAEEDRREAARRLTEIDRLRELERTRVRVLNSVSHELRTPLTPMRVQMHLLKEVLPAGEERGRRAVAVLERNLDRLSAVAEDILEAAQSEASRAPAVVERVDLAAVARHVAAEAAGRAADAGVDLRVALQPANTLGDPRRLRQVLQNLVDNAVKFTPAGGAVTLRVGALEGWSVVRVEDTGEGLRAEDLQGLFTPFARFHEACGPQRRGAGLGLVIARGIVERHGGALWATSDGPGKGSVFSFALPEARDAPVGAKRAPAARSAPRLFAGRDVSRSRPMR